MIFEFDDLGSNHVISDQIQSHDCRDALDKLHYANPAFKVTLFAIPGEMTAELCNWCKSNSSWVELAVHGVFHTDNYECSSMDYLEINKYMGFFKPMLDEFFVKGFRAPGWQISDDWYTWLLDHGYWVADQSYNNARRPIELLAYVNNNGNFTSYNAFPIVFRNLEVHHGHCWDCCGNGIYETYNQLEDMVKNTDKFEFVSEAFNE